jgi:hypothetical protein
MLRALAALVLMCAIGACSSEKTADQTSDRDSAYNECIRRTFEKRTIEEKTRYERYKGRPPHSAADLKWFAEMSCLNEKADDTELRAAEEQRLKGERLLQRLNEERKKNE